MHNVPYTCRVGLNPIGAYIKGKPFDNKDKVPGNSEPMHVAMIADIIP